MILIGCIIGYYGASCEQKCQCENNGQCHIITGACACKDGFIGPTCSEPCPKGRYGPNCALKCDCQNGGSCNIGTGLCSCLPGYTGKKCEDSK